jgi:hypothetical protein
MPCRRFFILAVIPEMRDFQTAAARRRRLGANGLRERPPNAKLYAVR